MKILKWLIVVLLVTALAGAGYWIRSRTLQKTRSLRKIMEAQVFLEHGDPKSAWLVLRSVQKPDEHTDLYPLWYHAQASFAIQSGDYHRLERLQNMSPRLFSLLPDGDNWIERLRMEDEGKVDTTLPRSPAPEITKADIAIKNGEHEQAVHLLEGIRLQGDSEIARLLRLAVLNEQVPATAWSYIQQAARLAPSDPKVRTYGAYLLELSGDYPHAQQEYAGAMMQQPSNEQFRQNLIGFFLRIGNPLDALKVMSATPGFSDDRELRKQFWLLNRLSLSKSTRLPSCPDSSELIQLGLGSIPDDGYFSQKLETQLLENPSLPKADRVVFFLNLLQLLKENKKKEALALLNEVDPLNYWNMVLFQSALKRVLGDTNEHFNLPVAEDLRKDNPFWNWLVQHQNDQSALQTPWVLPVFFSTYGWTTIADEFTPEHLPPDTPDWARYTLAKACAIAGDTKKSELIASAGNVPALMLVKAEKQISQGQKEEAISILKKLADDDVVGTRASCLLAETYLEQNHPEEALMVLNGNHALDISLEGNELRARILLLTKNEDGARGIYKAIVDESDIAKLYLAKDSYLHQDYKMSEKLTKQLLLNHPTDSLLLKNLSLIEAKLSTNQISGTRETGSPSK